ncbi:MAG: HAMP domain-containing sensor histidine kinase [Anaerolineae bacterium]
MLLPPLNSEDILLAARVAQLLNRNHRIAFAHIAADLKIIRASENLRTLTITPALPVEGRTLAELFWEFIGADDTLSAIMRGEAPPYVIRRVNRRQPDGSNAYLTFQVVPYDDGQFSSGLLLMIEDTTSASQLEQRLTQDRNELRLVQEQLAQANLELQRLSRFKTAVLSIAAQDLQTPLAVVRLYADLLLREVPALTNDQRKYASVIRAQVDKVSHMITGLFDFDQIEDGQLALNMTNCDLNDLIRKSVDMLDALFDLHQIDVALNLPEVPPRLQADTERVQRMIYDLLSYAMRNATTGSRVDIRLSSERRQAVVRITYSGRALNQEQLAELFQNYYRADAARRLGYAASGLGLLIAKTIVEAHGGHIEVVRQTEQETAFSVYLPLD